MNRTADELIEAMRHCLECGGVDAFLLGDNEMARLVVEYERLKGIEEEAQRTVQLWRPLLGTMEEGA